MDNFIKKLGSFGKVFCKSAPISVMVINKEGKIIFVNKYFKNFSGSDNSKKRSIFDIPFFIQNKISENYKKLLKNGVPFERNFCETENIIGEKKYINIVAVPLHDNKGGIDGALSMAADATEIVLSRTKLEKLNAELEEKVGQRTKQLLESNRKLNKIVESRLQFLADASYELKTPISVVQLYLELEKNKANNKRINGLSMAINGEIKRISEILDDLISINKINHGKQK